MSAMDIFWAAPPVSRTLTAAAVMLSVPTWMGLIEPYYIAFLSYKIFTWRSLPEIWRFVTPFLLTGPKLGMILDPYFLYTYGSQLENESARFSQPGEFFVYIIFLAVAILTVCGGFMGGVLFMSPLTLALAYTYAQDQPNRQLSYFIITFSAKYLPYAMLAMTFVMGSPAECLLQSSGLIAAHLYDFLTKIWPEYGAGRKFINTPLFVRKWFEKPAGVAQQRAYGMAYSGAATGPQNVPQQRQAGNGGGWASGFSGGSSSYGQGRRLGGD